MAKKQNKPATKKSSQEQDIVINNIHIGQLTRGSQTIPKWIQNIKAAERVTHPNRKGLLDTYHDIGIDLHLSSVEAKRIRAVKTTPFEWEGLDNNLIIENFQSPWFFEFLEQTMDVVFKGHRVIECVLQDGLIVNTIPLPRQNTLPIEGVITKHMYGSSDDGWRFREPPYDNFMLEVGKPDELGMYAKLAPYILLKRGNLGDYSRFNEMFGMPLRWYEYDPHTPGAREDVTKQAEAQGAAAYVVVPKGTTVNFHEANQSGASTTYQDLHNLLNDEITIGVLGQKLTTDSDGSGSYALGNIHKEVEGAINLEDRLRTEYLLNYTFKNNILIPHGYPLDGVKGSFKVSDELPKDKKAEIWLKMEEKMPISPEDFYNEFGVPHPDEKAIEVWTGRKSKLPTAKPGGAGDEGKP